MSGAWLGAILIVINDAETVVQTDVSLRVVVSKED